jgi:ubiquinone/menaquinone biosynthesis C-methylase UbiE
MDIKSKLGISLLAHYVEWRIKNFLSSETDYLYKDWFPERAASQEVATREWLSGRTNSELAVDIGCADGWHTKIVSEYYKKVIGIDINANLLEIASIRNGAPNIEFIEGDQRLLSNYPKPDLVSVCGVLTYVISDKKAEQALRDIFSVLPEGGLLLAKDTLHDDGLLRTTKGHSAIYRSESAWLNLFTRAGFSTPTQQLILDAPVNGFYSKLVLFEKC